MAQRSFVALVICASVATFAGVYHLSGPAASATTAPTASTASVDTTTIYYAGCDAVRAADKAPLLASQPGYRVEMDGDGDGIACEPYAGDGSHRSSYGFGGSRSRRRH